MSDDNAKLPRALRKQLERSDQLLKERTSPPAKAEAEPTVQPQPQSEPAPQPAAQPAAEPEKTPEPTANWEHRFKTVQGILGAEREKHRQETSDLRAEVEALRESVNRPQTRTPDAGVVSLPEGSISEALKQDDADPALINAFEKLERSHAQLQQQYEQALAANQDLAADVKRLASMQNNVGRHMELSYWDQLDSAVPDMDEVNVDPDFVLYMQSVDPDVAALTGDNRTRQQLIDEAHGAQDARRVIAFYDRFKQTRATPEQPTRPQTPSVPIDPAPSTGNGEGPPRTGHQWSISEWQQAHEMITKGRIRGAEADRLEHELEQARREGRIVGNAPGAQRPTMNPNAWGTLDA